MAMMISRVARVNSSHPYLENDSSSSLVSYRLRISPWLWFSLNHVGDAGGELVQLLATDHLVPDIVEFGQDGLELVVLPLEACRAARRDSSGSRPQLGTVTVAP